MKIFRSDRPYSVRRSALNLGSKPATGVLLALLLPFGSLHALAQSANAANVKSVTTTLAGSAARKECITVSNHQRLRYWYRAEGPVNFDIQYVDADARKTVYPVKRDKAAIGSGTFQPKSAQDYCLVWTNVANRGVNLSFEFARVGN